MKKNYLAFFTVLLSLFSFMHSLRAQTTIYSTDFGTVANVNPSQWTFNGIDMTISTNNPSSGYTSASGNAYLGEGNSTTFTNTSGTPFSGSQTGTSEAILLVNTSGYSTVTLGFGMRKSSAGYNSNATYSLGWSTNGTSYTAISYTEAAAGGWGLASGAGLTLPAGAGNQNTLYIKWTFVRTGTASNFKIDDVSIIANSASSGNGPTIAMNVATTSNYLDGGATVSPSSPFALSGVISDPTDPARNAGLDFTISDPVTAVSNLTVTAVSNNTTVVPNANINLTGSGASRNIKISPAAVGFANITLSVFNGTSTTSYVLYYGASAASSTPSSTLWHTGMSDASDAIVIDDNYYISGDDELDILNVYSRSASGLPLVSFDYSSALGLSTASSPEVDLEAGTPSPASPNKVYWMGSMSTGGSSFSIRPNRDRLFATTYTGTGASTTFSVVGYYSSLRTQLVSWGDVNGYNFSASSASGVDSKSTSGFAAEGMVFGPDNTTLYVGFRAPLVPIATRTNAVIAPISNFETWFNNGSPSGNPTIGAPIELNLGGRGIRDLIRLANGTYIILAGNSAGSPITSAIFKWTGNSQDNPVLVASSANGILNMEGVMPININSQQSLNQLQIISDGGGDVLYNNNVESKDLTDLSLRKFRSDRITNLDLCLTPSSLPVITQSGESLSSTSASAYQWYFNTTAIPGATLQTYTATQAGNYFVVTTNTAGCDVASANITVVAVGIAKYKTNNNDLSVYPNPLTENTSIHLTLNENAVVSIEVYSVLGQKVETITNTSYTAGSYTFTLNPARPEYSNGVYYLKTLVNNALTVTRLIKNNP